MDQLIKETESLLPALRDQHEQTIQELDREQKEIADLERSDPSFLEELKTTIDDQK